MAKSDKRPVISDDLVDDIMAGLGGCSCGRPYIFVRQLYDYLKIAENIGLPDDKYIPYMYIADALGLTEHGSSVYGAWLTEKGKEIVKRVENDSKKHD